MKTSLLQNWNKILSQLTGTLSFISIRTKHRSTLKKCAHFMHHNFSVLKKGQRLMVFENKVFKKIFGAKRDKITGEWRKLHNTELYALYSSPNTGVFNLLSSRANLHLSYNPAGRSHCRLQNHHGYIKHHHRGMGSSPGEVGQVPMM